MSSKIAINRILDANINRVKEGLRVCEEITRFILEDKKLTLSLKQLRHKIDCLVKNLPADTQLIQQRNSLKDIGKNPHACELKRRNISDILFANIQRVKESLRVLEEFSKLINTNTAIGFKKIRYNSYELEKEITKKITALLHNR